MLSSHSGCEAPRELFLIDPFGPLARQAVYLTYNYTEDWLSGSLLSLPSPKGRGFLSSAKLSQALPRSEGRIQRPGPHLGSDKLSRRIRSDPFQGGLPKGDGTRRLSIVSRASGWIGSKPRPQGAFWRQTPNRFYLAKGYSPEPDTYC